MMWTDDPVADAAAYSEEQDRALARRPVCADCGEHIQDDYYYEIAGRKICPKCIEDYRVWID